MNNEILKKKIDIAYNLSWVSFICLVIYLSNGFSSAAILINCFICCILSALRESYKKD